MIIIACIVIHVHVINVCICLSPCNAVYCKQWQMKISWLHSAGCNDENLFTDLRESEQEDDEATIEDE